MLVAKQLNLATVPVQYIENNLNVEQQKQFLVKDNVLRRHLTPTERKNLYRFLVTDFDDKLELINSKSLGIDQKKLADETGLNPKTVGYDLAMMRRDAAKKRNTDSEIDLPDEKAIYAYKKACAHMLNIAILGSMVTLQKLREIHETTAKRLEGISH